VGLYRGLGRANAAARLKGGGWPQNLEVRWVEVRQHPVGPPTANGGRGETANQDLDQDPLPGVPLGKEVRRPSSVKKAAGYANWGLSPSTGKIVEVKRGVGVPGSRKRRLGGGPWG